MATVPVDGAMGTTLQNRGLPPNTAADGWVRERPDEVAAVHEAFVARGARVLRTATLCSRADPDLLAQGVSLARSAGPDEVWLSVGPVGPARSPTDDLDAALAAGGDRILLETFVSPTELVAAARWLASRGARVVASLVPGPDGLLADAPYPAAELREAGVEVLGLNCGADPTHALDAWRRYRDDGPWLVAPAWGPALPDVWRQLVGEVAFLGGCCGVDPARWEAAWPR